MTLWGILLNVWTSQFWIKSWWWVFMVDATSFLFFFVRMPYLSNNTHFKIICASLGAEVLGTEITTNDFNQFICLCYTFISRMNNEGTKSIYPCLCKIYSRKFHAGEAECWIYKISLMPMSGRMSWLLGFNLITITW